MKASHNVICLVFHRILDLKRGRMSIQPFFYWFFLLHSPFYLLIITSRGVFPGFSGILKNFNLLCNLYGEPVVYYLVFHRILDLETGPDVYPALCYIY